jgi:hypothetical protein
MERLTCDVTAQFGCCGTYSARRKLGRGSGDVWSNEQVWAAPQRVAIGERFGIGNVKSCADVARLQRDNQSIGLYDGAARCID